MTCMTYPPPAAATVSVPLSRAASDPQLSARHSAGCRPAGQTFAALASMCCLPVATAAQRLDEAADLAEADRGTEKDWGSAQSDLPVEMILQPLAANPLMVVDEIDKAGSFYSSKEPSSSRRK